MIDLFPPREECKATPASSLAPVFETASVVTASEAAETMVQFEQVEMPVIHDFAPGVYTRTIYMPAGTLVIGHVHKFEHYNIILKGRAVVEMDGETKELVAPLMFRSGAGVQKKLHILEDMEWTTVHPNPGNCEDVSALELGIVEIPASMLDKPPEMTLDDYRMLLTRNGLALKP